MLCLKLMRNLLIGGVSSASSTLCFDSTGLKFAPNYFFGVSSVHAYCSLHISCCSLMWLVQMPLANVFFHWEADRATNTLVNAISLLEVPESFLNKLNQTE